MGRYSHPRMAGKGRYVYRQGWAGIVIPGWQGRAGTYIGRDGQV